MFEVVQNSNPLIVGFGALAVCAIVLFFSGGFAQGVVQYLKDKFK